MNAEQIVRRKYQQLHKSLDERSRRLWAATEAKALGFGGVALVARVTDVSRSTIVRGLLEIQKRKQVPEGRIRRSGAGRKRSTVLIPDLREALERLVEPVSRGDPESPLRWTCKSTRRLAEELCASRRPCSSWLVGRVLRELGYSLQANQKTREGGRHPDRDAQFRHINAKVADWVRGGQPAISVDTKKKELVGDFKNGGREWRPRGRPTRVRVHDFIDRTKGKAIPYGVYDLARNRGWVSLGVDHDTSAFAVNTIRLWWKRLGAKGYAKARNLLIVADSGGSNGSRVRLWKWELHRLAQETGMTIHVCHLPPGTSKWNKIEHKMFSFISQNWRGQPLLTHATILKLISSTRTKKGLRITCVLDPGRYPDKIKVTDAQMASINLVPESFHGEWNYMILPSRC
jgi:hypothetical protein